MPGKETLPDLKLEEKAEEKKEEKEEITEEKEEPEIETKEEEKPEEQDDESAEIEDTILEIIKKLEGDDGAPWDSITEKCEKQGLDKDSIEEALSSLMEKGLIYEPVLGTIKTT
jgi:DNA replicative helicase MCM subunit Mcm2 (Cdc46/Mcm family)